jgi:hypothetical protein
LDPFVDNRRCKEIPFISVRSSSLGSLAILTLLGLLELLYVFLVSLPIS